MADWLKVEGLRFSYGPQRVFDGLDLAVDQAECVVALIGRSGVGKTTLLSLIAGLLQPEAGCIQVNGALVDAPSPSRPVVFQSYNLFPWLTVLDNVAFGLKCQGISGPARRQQARELLAHMQLTGVETLLPTMLSGGMQQRVGLARALAVNPDCVLMDEPFSALDSATKEPLLATVTAFAAVGRPRFLLITHDIADAVLLGDRVLLLQDERSVVSRRITAPPHPRPLAFRYTPVFHAELEALRALVGEQTTRLRS